MANRVAIAGIGESRLGRVPGKTTLQLISDATLNALDDSGLPLASIDAVITTPVRVEPWAMPAGIVSSYLGISPRYLSTVDVAGASGAAMIHQAAMAIASGACNTVLCISGQALLSTETHGDPIKAMAEAGVAHTQFEMPYGPLVASLYALLAQRHMAEFGTTPEQLAEVAVAIRSHAALNDNAYKRKPITIEDVITAKRITSPLGLLDCSIVADGAAACIVTSVERARHLRQTPVRVLGQGYGLSHSYVGEYTDLTTVGAVRSGTDAFRAAGVTPQDIDVVELYDCFTITVLIQLEDLGFCPKGEGGRFVEGGRIRPGGPLPVTTHGGLLSAGHPGVPGGFFHVLEGVRQVRGTAGARQVKNAELALVHGNGGVAAVHCTMILGQEAA